MKFRDDAYYIRQVLNGDSSAYRGLVEKHQDLVVRVTGFSARFVVLPEATQVEVADRSCWNA